MKKEDGTASLESSVSSSSSVVDKDTTSRKAYTSWFPWRRSQTTQEQSNVDSLNSFSESRNSTKSKESPNKGKLSDSPSKAGSKNNNQQGQSVTSSSDESEGSGIPDSRISRPSRIGTLAIPIQDPNNSTEKFKKTLRLSSDQIVSPTYHNKYFNRYE